VALIADLGDDFFLERFFPHGADLGDGVGQRFFAIDVFAALHGGHGGDEVSVVRRSDEDGVKFVAHFVEHFTEILEDSA
jgi:hypothetical protein